VDLRPKENLQQRQSKNSVDSVRHFNGAMKGMKAMDRKTLTIEVAMESYIAHPYWPERERVIQIELHSHVKMLKSDDKKAAAIKGQLEKDGLTLEDFEELKRKAAREWYRLDCDDSNTEIIIPRHQVAGALVETINRTPKAVNGGYNADSFRHVVRIADFHTGKTKADGTYSRYVKLDTSNKRSLQENEFIEKFLATGSISVSTDAKADVLKRLFAYAFDEVGVGAARKMGYGRGRLVKCE